jgi:hypothetical protein
MKHLYSGISEEEVHVLEALYDRVAPIPRETVGHREIHLLRAEGTTETYRVYFLFFREATLFVYTSAESKDGGGADL